jgi:hypothetical protein
MTTYTGSITEHSSQEKVREGWRWACNAYIFEDGLLTAHGLGDTPSEAIADAWEQFWFTKRFDEEP